MQKTLFIGALFSTLILSACTEEEISNFFGSEDKEITVSGKTNNTSDTAEPEVRIEGVYVTPVDTSNPTVDSDTSGEFSLLLNENESFYLRASKSGFVSISSRQMNLSSDETDVVIEMPTGTEVQDMINAAFTSSPQLFNHAWLVVDVVTTTDDEANGYEVALSAIPAGAVYTSCNGTDSGLSETTGAPCPSDRSAPMYIAYYDTAGDVIATVGVESQTASIRMGEITSLEFVLP
jgi:hypothetical protein